MNWLPAAFSVALVPHLEKVAADVLLKILKNEPANGIVKLEPVAIMNRN